MTESPYRDRANRLLSKLYNADAHEEAVGLLAAEFDAVAKEAAEKERCYCWRCEERRKQKPVTLEGPHWETLLSDKANGFTAHPRDIGPALLDLREAVRQLQGEKP